MTTYSFVDLDEAFDGLFLPLAPTDIVLFPAGSALTASVAYPPSQFTPIVTVSFDGGDTNFDFGVVAVSANHNLRFTDGSQLLIGGSDADSLTATSGDAAIFGGAGNDLLTGLTGRHVVQGNQGDDSVVTGAGADTIYGGQGDDAVVTGQGQAGEAGDFAQGNKGDDTIRGGGGSDTLLGGQGDDVIQAGAGDDYLSGDRGGDTLTGGAGADTFHMTDDGRVDVVADFHLAEGDRIQVDPGTTFQLSQAGADTIMTFADGGKVVLSGVQMSTLHGDWIFSA